MQKQKLFTKQSLLSRFLQMFLFCSIIAAGPVCANAAPAGPSSEIAESAEGETENTYYTVHDGKHTASLSKELQDYVYEMCSEYGISGQEPVILAKLYCESGYTADIIHRNSNGSCDYGMSQINSCNHKRLSRILGITDFLDPYQSIRAGVYMMSECMKSNQFDESMALSAYNRGVNGIASTDYSRRVLSIKDTMTVNR